MIRFSNVSIKQKTTVILSNLSFHITEGESVALMGLNGVGKSTVLKTLLGLHTNYTGAVFLKGIPLPASKSRKIVTYLPEKFHANSSLTGERYLRCLLRDESYKNFATRLDLPEKTLQKKIKSYSKGMLQKLGLISFFSQHMPLKIADEIMCGLDFKMRPLIIDLIKEQQKKGTTFLFSTHLHQDAIDASDRLIFLEETMQA